MNKVAPILLATSQERRFCWRRMFTLMKRHWLETVFKHKLEEVFAVFEQMGSYHPSVPHWYLPLIGVDPALHGKGYGSALMEHALTHCDRDQKLAYLESSNPKNRTLHERHGFELLGTIQVGSSPPICPMLRKPRPL